MNAAGIARRLGATRQGHNWRCACPRDCGYALSLADGEGGQLLLHCFGGCEFDEIMPALVEYGLLDGDYDPDPIDVVERRVDAHRRNDADRIAQAREIYNQAAWDPKIQIYLRSRGIVLTSPALRFSAAAPHRLGIRLPAILAPIVNVNGEQTGVHLTYLRRDGSGKADLGSREFQRECRGLVRGGVIRLAEHDPDYPLIIGEGIETTLSAMQIFGRLGWSAVHAAGLKTVELPLDVRHIVIAVDNDTAGRQCALAAHQRWSVGGRSVRIVMPPRAGIDFNEVLMERFG